MDKTQIINYYDSIAPKRLKYRNRNKYYYKNLEKYLRFIIPEGSRVIELGCGTGDLLNSVKPRYGVGVDFSKEMVSIAKSRFPELKFVLQDVEELALEEKFDYVIISDLITSLNDIQRLFNSLSRICSSKTKIIFTYYNYFWEPVNKLAEIIGIKAKQPLQNWLSVSDVKNLLHIEGFEIIKSDCKLLFPYYLPLISGFFNSIAANLPLINKLGLINISIVRKSTYLEESKEKSVSIIVPARNEKGNIENSILQTPEFGSSQEFIFVDGNSKDGTYEEMLRVKEKYKEKNINVFKQSGSGKGNAVREGFDKAEGDVLMILDSDLTTPPEDLPKFYNAIVKNRGEFINGCRLIYPMEKQAMRFLNLIANKFFGVLFTYLLGQNLKDTLCGTKVLLKEDYERIKQNRSYFGNFDPFGDFDLLFGAAKLNLKIVEIPVRYKDRVYGETQISRFKHGWLLIKMSVFAARKIKFF